MSARRRLERRRLGLPPARSAVLETDTWIAASDGTRLATRVLRPADARVWRGTVLIRTERPLGGGFPLEKLARWLAEDGRTVLLQTCRGRDASEGRFRPFLDEVADGRDALRWAAARPGADGAVVLVGLGYAAHTAWAAAAGAPECVAGLATGFGARDPYAWLHPGGVLQLEVALALAARLDGRRGFEPEELDLVRAARHRPLAECDRVAVRELAAFRDWVAHPQRDAWWEARTPDLPAAAAPALFLGGFYEGALPAALADFRALGARAEACGAAAPALMLGPWGATARAGGARARGADPIAAIARAVQGFTAQVVGARARRERPARVYVGGVGWRESAAWPPAEARPHTLYLRGDAPANSRAGAGRLTAEPPGRERADSFVDDPADPVPSQGGVAIAGVAGRGDPGSAAERGDVLCFTSDPLPEPIELAGGAWLLLHTDPAAASRVTCATLSAVGPDGTARWLCEGAARSAPGDGAPLRIELGPAAARLAVGMRLRLAVAGSSLPRFARPEDASPQRRVLYHDAERASALHFDALDTSRDDCGPAGERPRAR